MPVGPSETAAPSALPLEENCNEPVGVEDALEDVSVTVNVTVCEVVIGLALAVNASVVALTVTDGTAAAKKFVTSIEPRPVARS